MKAFVRIISEFFDSEKKYQRILEEVKEKALDPAYSGEPVVGYDSNGAPYIDVEDPRTAHAIMKQKDKFMQVKLG